MRNNVSHLFRSYKAFINEPPGEEKMLRPSLPNEIEITSVSNQVLCCRSKRRGEMGTHNYIIPISAHGLQMDTANS